MIRPLYNLHNLQKDPLVKPFLKWAGGKRQLLLEIKNHLPDNMDDLRYFEPFVGAGALFLELQPYRAVINDYNEELILSYKVIKENVIGLIEALKAHKEQNNDDYFYQVREQDRDRDAFAALTDVTKAARLIYLNKTCYNGLYRVNSRGHFNVPYGRYANPSIYDEPVLIAIHEYLNQGNIKILNGDFSNAVENAGQDSFIYFDPPYHSRNKTGFTGYQAGGFNDDDQRRLRDVFAAKTETRAKCLISNSDTPFIRELYCDSRFEIITVKAKRAINSAAAGRGEINEVLIKNYSE